MSEFPTERSVYFTEKSEAKRMTTVAEASLLLMEIAGHPGSVKERIRRAATAVAINFGRVEDLWRQEARMVRADEMDRIREQAERKRRRQATERVDADDYARVVERLRILEERLAALDAHLAGETVPAARQGRSGKGRKMDRPGAEVRAVEREG